MRVLLLRSYSYRAFAKTKHRQYNTIESSRARDDQNSEPKIAEAEASLVRQQVTVDTAPPCPFRFSPVPLSRCRALSTPPKKEVRVLTPAEVRLAACPRAPPCPDGRPMPLRAQVQHELKRVETHKTLMQSTAYPSTMVTGACAHPVFSVCLPALTRGVRRGRPPARPVHARRPLGSEGASRRKSAVSVCLCGRVASDRAAGRRRCRGCRRCTRRGR